MQWFDRRQTFLHLAGWILAAAVLLAQHARAAEATHALAPLDTSSPRATLTGFLGAMDEGLRLTRDHFLKSWTMDAQVRARVEDLYARAYRTLDVSNVPPDAQTEVSRDAASYLYEVLSRIELPPEGETPGEGAFEEGKKNVKWTIPNTEITLARADEGPRAGQFLFSPETVARAREFYEQNARLAARSRRPAEERRRATRQHGRIPDPASRDRAVAGLGKAARAGARDVEVVHPRRRDHRRARGGFRNPPNGRGPTSPVTASARSCVASRRPCPCSS